MKTKDIPYAVVWLPEPPPNEWKGYWTSLDFFNSGNETQAAVVKVRRHSTGVISKEITVTVPAKGHAIVSPQDLNDNLNEPTSRCSIHIVMADDLQVTPWMNSPTPFQILPLEDAAANFS